MSGFIHSLSLIKDPSHQNVLKSFVYCHSLCLFWKDTTVLWEIVANISLFNETAIKNSFYIFGRYCLYSETVTRATKIISLAEVSMEN